MADETPTSELGKAVQDVTERAQVLVREEIALAKTELTEKATELGKGAAAGAVAGVFALFGLLFLLHALAWGIWKVIGWGDNYWLGFLIVAVLLFVIGAIGALLAKRFFAKGAPPTPQMAIDEGKLIRQTITTAREAGPAPPLNPVSPPPTASPREVDR